MYYFIIGSVCYYSKLMSHGIGHSKTTGFQDNNSVNLPIISGNNLPEVIAKDYRFFLQRGLLY
jgi:hypothetical protein